MRTTLTLDDDLAERVRELAHRTRKPFKVVLNQALRTGIGIEEKGGMKQEPFVQKTYPLGLEEAYGKGVNFNHVAWELEDEEILSRMRRKAT